MLNRSAFIALGLVMASALPALAETSTTTVALTGQTPNPSIVGQSVTLGVTVTKSSPSTANCGGTVDITDTTSGPPTAVCTAVAVTGAAADPLTGTCNFIFPTEGTRTLALAYTPTGSCNASTGAGSQSVASNVPTLTEWAMWLLAGLMMLGGTALVARRTQRQQA